MSCLECYWYDKTDSIPVCKNLQAIDNIEICFDQYLDWEDWEDWEDCFCELCEQFSKTAPIPEGQMNLGI